MTFAFVGHCTKENIKGDILFKSQSEDCDILIFTGTS